MVFWIKLHIVVLFFIGVVRPCVLSFIVASKCLLDLPVLLVISNLIFLIVILIGIILFGLRYNCLWSILLQNAFWMGILSLDFFLLFFLN